MKVNHSSVTSLLMLCVLAATLIYTCVICTIIYTQINDTLDILRNRSLSQQAYDIAISLETRGSIPDKDTPLSGEALYGNVGAHNQYVVRDAASGRTVLHSPAGFADSFPASDGVTNEYFYFTAPQGGQYAGASIRYTIRGRDYIIQTAQSEDSADNFSDILRQTFFERIAMFGIPFLFILMLVIAMSIKLIMSPITKTLKQTREISFANPDVRLDDSTLPQEIKPLARAVNDALDRLEKGITAQKDFIASAAHELRTPLAILRSHVDLLEEKDVAARMRDDVDSMARMVSQLLDTARLESPERLEMHEIDLADVVKTVSQDLWPLMVKEAHAFDVKGIETPVLIYGHFDSVCRALRNLLENTLKYTPKGSPVTVALRDYRIEVRDHGGGIDDQEKERIFEKFSRRDGQRSSGAGLGLFIVKRIMELHGGTVTVANAEGGGSVFTLQFPASG